MTQYETGGGQQVRILDLQFVDAHRGWALRADGVLLKTTTGGKAP